MPFFYWQIAPLEFTTECRGTDLRPLGCGATVSQCLQGGIGWGLDRSAQEVGMILEGPALTARVGLRGATAAAAKPPPPFLHEREAAPEALRNGVLWCFAALQRGENSLTKIWGVQQFPLMNCESYVPVAADSSRSVSTTHFRLLKRLSQSAMTGCLVAGRLIS